MTGWRPALQKAISTWDTLFGNPWRLIPFQPILYFFLWGATIRLWVNQSEPPKFDTVLAHGTYGIWLFLGFLGPPLSLLSWRMIRRPGRVRFIGLWVRFSSDVMVFTAILAYHVVTAVTTHQPSEARMFARYLVGSTLLFTLCLIVRDVAAITLVERVARRIHRGREDG